jgi:hypothetical protein
MNRGAHHLVRDVEHDSQGKRPFFSDHIPQTLTQKVHSQKFKVRHSSVAKNRGDRGVSMEKLENGGLVLQERSLDKQRHARFLERNGVVQVWVCSVVDCALDNGDQVSRDEDAKMRSRTKPPDPSFSPIRSVIVWGAVVEAMITAVELIDE